MPRKVFQKTKPKHIAAAEQKIRAVQLRTSGKSYTEIAERLGISRATAYRYIKCYLDELNGECRELAPTVRMIELIRLDSYLNQLEEKIRDGDTVAINTALKIAERRARYLGLDEPERHEVSAVDVSPEAAARQIREVFGGHAMKSDDSETEAVEATGDGETT